MRTEGLTQDSDSMDVDLPAYRPVAPTEKSETISQATYAAVRLLTEFNTLLVLLASTVKIGRLAGSGTNPFSEITHDGIRAFVDSNPELKQDLEGILQSEDEDAAEDQLSRIIAFCK